MSAKSNGTDARFKDAMDEAKWRYSNHGLTCGTRAYEYGVLVVRNAFLVAGGGLVFIPTMVGLSASVDLNYAVVAGVFFGLAVLLSLVGNYVIHWNWMLHENAWNYMYDIERIQIRKSFDLAFDRDEDSRKRADKGFKRTSKGIHVTFWIPHALVVLYIIFICVAAYYLYLSFGIVREGGNA